MRYDIGDKVVLITDVPYPDGGASVDAGAECKIVAKDELRGYLVETLEEQWDPGTGCGDGSEGYRVSTFEADDSMLTSVEHMLSDLIRLRENGQDDLSRLYEVADKYEVDVLDNLVARAGFVWVCSCSYRNDLEDNECGDCGKRRPQQKE